MQTLLSGTAAPATAASLAGKGLSSSSNTAALRAAEDILARGLLPTRAEVTRRALETERRNAGHCVATQDVLAIVHGGLVAVHTWSDGRYGAVPVPCDPAWVKRHLLLAVNQASRGHDVPTLLSDLFAHPRRREFVADFSVLVAAARAALERGDAAALGDTMNLYRPGFDEWTGGAFTSAVRGIMVEFEREAVGLHGWKPPGAGATEAVALVMDGTPESHASATRFFRARGWQIGPVEMTDGLAVLQHTDGTAEISAGLRLDLIGAADLSADPAIAADGLCLSLAISPRTMRVVRVPAP